MHPEVEAALHAEFREMRQKVLKVKGYWFKLRARQLLEEKELGATFLFQMDGLIDLTRSASGDQRTLLRHQPVTKSPSSAGRVPSPPKTRS